jgi:hypothetical protein
MSIDAEEGVTHGGRLEASKVWTSHCRDRIFLRFSHRIRTQRFDLCSNYFASRRKSACEIRSNGIAISSFRKFAFSAPLSPPAEIPCYSLLAGNFARGFIPVSRPESGKKRITDRNAQKFPADFPASREFGDFYSISG